MDSKLKHWQLIRELNVDEAAKLIAGIDPNCANLTPTEQNEWLTIRRSIKEAVARAGLFAFQHCQQMELARIHEQNELFEEMKMTTDIWESADNFRDYLPSWEQREQLADVFKDFDTHRMASPSHPNYSATVYAGDFRSWIERNELESSFRFVDEQKITVVPVGGNPDSTAAESSQATSVEQSTGVRPSSAQGAEKALSTRERDALLRIIGGLLELMQDQRLHKADLSGTAKIIEALVQAYGDKDGISMRNLQGKFALAKRTLEAD
jgi:hypothetical protein